MAEIINLTLPDLLIDPENPRLPMPNIGQREALRSIATLLGPKLLALAKDILQYRLNPSDLPIVTPSNDDLKRYVVLEGNRRLAALKILENPEPIVGAVDSAVLAEFRSLSKQYQEAPIESIACMSVKNKSDAEHWIELRHTGQNAGAGIVPWGSDENSRFRSRKGGLELSTQVLNFLEHRGELTPDERRKVPHASLKRVLGTPAVREKCAIGWEDGKMTLLASPGQVAKALLYIVKDLASGKTKTEHIYNTEKRVAYANALPASVIVKPAAQTSQGIPADSVPAPTKSKRQSAMVKSPKPRNVLIPRECAMTITDARVRDIAIELRSLSLEDHPNAISVLFRVFVELSTDAYIVSNPSCAAVDRKLRSKLTCVLADLLKRTKITSQQVNPVRRALQKGSFLAPSVDLMHDYVHNQNVFPAPSDLRAHWNSLQPFVMAIWS